MIAPTPVLVSEICLTTTFAVLLAYGGGRLSRTDKLLWSLLWLTRLLASLGGSRHLEGAPPALAMYIGLQVCAASAVLLIFVRTEALIFKERWARRFVLQVARATQGHTGAEPGLLETSRETPRLPRVVA